MYFFSHSLKSFPRPPAPMENLAMAEAAAAEPLLTMMRHVFASIETTKRLFSAAVVAGVLRSGVGAGMEILREIPFVVGVVS